MPVGWMSPNSRLPAHPQAGAQGCRGWAGLWVAFLAAQEQYPTAQNDSVGSVLAGPSLTSMPCMPKPLKRYLECFCPVYGGQHASCSIQFMAKGGMKI